MDCHYNLAKTTNRMVAKYFCTVQYITTNTHINGWAYKSG